MILNTFIHFTSPLVAFRRSVSCPPECFVDHVINIAKIREAQVVDRQARLRARIEQSEKKREAERLQQEEDRAIDDILEECRIQKIDELWDCFSKRSLALFRVNTCRKAAEFREQVTTLWAIMIRRAVQMADQLRVQEVISMVGEEKVKRMLPRRRVVIDKPTFQEMMYALFDSDEALRALRKMGVVRERHDCYELWAADDAASDSLMQRIIDTAQRASNVRQARAFHIFIPGEVPIVLPWVRSLTLKQLHGNIAEILHLSPNEYGLFHLGKALKGRKYLKDEGIMPGSFIRLAR